jgi:hypothetical protein
LDAKEKDMPTCVLCGLIFSNRALLELHIREEHPKRNGPAEAAHGNIRAHNAAQLRSGCSATGDMQAASQAAAAGVTTVPAGRRQRSRRVVTALRRTIGSVQHATEDLRHALDVIFGAERKRNSGPRPSPTEGTDGQAARTTKYGDRAA